MTLSGSGQVRSRDTLVLPASSSLGGKGVWYRMVAAQHAIMCHAGQSMVTTLDWCEQTTNGCQCVMYSTTTTTTVLRLFVRDYLGEPVPEETLTHPPSWSSSNLYQLLPSTMIHSILPVQIECLAIFLHNLSPCPLWSTSCSEALRLTFHTFLHRISVVFSQHMPIPSCCSISIISSIPSLSLCGVQ